jgi:hypothetical protein
MLGLPVHLPLILIVLATFVGVLTTAYGLSYPSKYGRTKPGLACNSSVRSSNGTRAR